MAGGAVAGSLALSVHGPAGVIDVVVPPGAAAIDVAREYAATCGLREIPPLITRSGRALKADEVLSDIGIASGDLLAVAAPAEPMSRSARRAARSASRGDTHPPGPLSALAVTVACAAAVVAGWLAAHADGARHEVSVAALAVAALTGLVPTGRLAPRRAVTAPAFAGAAAFAVAWDPTPERLPTILGVAGLFAAVVAAAARAVDRRAEEALRVWIIVGVAFFGVTFLAALADVAASVVWAVVLVVLMLAARIVPAYAIDVPDTQLLALDRLAVSAWSAHEQPRGKRSRTMVPVEAVAAVAASGARTLLAASVAVLALTALAAPLLLATATVPIDRTGARALVFLVGAALLLAARSYRYAVPRRLLRIAGLLCWGVLVLAVIDDVRGRTVVALVVGAVALAAALVVAAVATGRGWRSVKWSRRAEIAEGIAGSFAIAACVVATGVFRVLWET